MVCLECKKMIGRGKYCSKKCGTAYRVRRFRNKVKSNNPEVLEKVAKGIEEEKGDSSPTQEIPKIRRVSISSETYQKDEWIDP